MAKCANCKYKSTTYLYNEMKDFCKALDSVIEDSDKDQECKKFEGNLILEEM